MRTLRDKPPVELAGLTVTRADDLTAGTPDLPPTDGLRYYLAGPAVDSARIVVRPSGTEPKLKCYLEAVLPVASAAGLDSARDRARDLMDILKQDLAVAAGLA